MDTRDLLGLQQLANRYWARADGTAECAVADMFTEDAVFNLGSLTLTGHKAIEDFFRERDEAMSRDQRVTRHVACNFLVTPAPEGRMRVRSTVLVFSGSGFLPLPSGAPTGIADVDDLCVRSSGGAWRYVRREIRSVFIGEDAPAFARGKPT